MLNTLLKPKSKLLQPLQQARHASTAKRAGARALPYTLHAYCSSNNTILTLSISSRSDAIWQQLRDERKAFAGQVVKIITAGRCGFKGARRGTLEAGTKTTIDMMRYIELVMDKDKVKVDPDTKKETPKLTEEQAA
jgi:ribosomal protein S11